jgi:hypothetical protein
MVAGGACAVQAITELNRDFVFDSSGYFVGNVFRKYAGSAKIISRHSREGGNP